MTTLERLFLFSSSRVFTNRRRIDDGEKGEHAHVHVFFFSRTSSCTSFLLHVVRVTDHIVGLPLDATIFRMMLLLLLLLLLVMLLLLMLMLMLMLMLLLLLLLLLLLMMVVKTDAGRALLLLLLLVERQLTLDPLKGLLIQSFDLLQARLIRRPRGPLVSVVTEFSWLLIVLLVDHVLESETQGPRITVKPQGLFQSLLLQSQRFPCEP